MITVVIPGAEFSFDIVLLVVSIFVLVIATEMTCILSVARQRIK